MSVGMFRKGRHCPEAAGTKNPHELARRVDGNEFFVCRFALPSQFNGLPVADANGFVGRELYARQAFDRPQRGLEERQPIAAGQRPRINRLFHAKAADGSPYQRRHHCGSTQRFGQIAPNERI